MEGMILAILQARFSSSRLPGKVLKSILGMPMLLHQIERLKHSQMIDKLVVATSDDVSDNAIDNGCTVVVPGSHNIGRYTDRDFSNTKHLVIFLKELHSH